jgi:phosphohistidine phosphatase
MKQLILIRHAKSDWGKENLRDIDRHLNARGYDDAYMMSAWLANRQGAPDLILTSTATRALSTALIFSRAYKQDIRQFNLEPSIYEATRDELKAIISSQDNKVERLIVVGHNPGLTDVCNAFSDELYFDNVPTCGMIAFKADCKNWHQLADGRWPVEFYQFPKDYKDQD